MLVIPTRRVAVLVNAIQRGLTVRIEHRQMSVLYLYLTYVI